MIFVTYSKITRLLSSAWVGVASTGRSGAPNTFAPQQLTREARTRAGREGDFGNDLDNLSCRHW